MATGDNVLTAISVGRECNIIDAESEVFLGDVKKEGNKEVVYWKSTKHSKNELSPHTLLPEQEFFNNEEKKPGYLYKSQLKDTKVGRESFREEDERSVNDVVSLDDFPW
jgi:magnesium-transporting ATPase (P-type)